MRSVILPRARRWAAAAAVLVIGCGDPAARVRVAVHGGDCARPDGGNSARVTAYTAAGEHSVSLGLDQTLSITEFPADTEQIGVEVVVGGGATGAQGKSAPLAFGDLPDGAVIPILMGPPDGFCELPAMLEPRSAPLVAPAGDGALVVGGIGAAGPLSTAEYYDPAAAAFVAVTVPSTLIDDRGFIGAALATLPDGRVALVGGPQRAFVIFDPESRAFVTDPTVVDNRAFHAAIAAGNEVIVAGGCTEISQLACGGVARLQILRYGLTALREPILSAILAPGGRVGAQLFDLGPALDGRRRYLLAGGTSAPGTPAPPRADRFALDDTNAEALPGGHVRAAALDGGAVLTAFADDAATPDGAAAVYPPGNPAARAIAAAPALAGARLIGLEDGQVVGFGGDPQGRVLHYDPTHDAWRAELPASKAQTGALTAPSLARLTDGTVLVLGGAVSARAWLYRPSLVGPASGSITVIPASDVARGVLTAPDPASVTRVDTPLPAWLLATPPGAPGDRPLGRALVGGPRTRTGSVRAIVQVLAGGAALIAQQTGPGGALIAELAPGAPPRLVRLDGGAERELCAGTAAVALEPAAPVTLRLAIDDRDARLSVNDAEVLSCNISSSSSSAAGGERGAWGVASLGAGAQLAVASVTVAR